MVSEPGFDPGTCGLWAHHGLLRYVPYLVDEKPKVQWFLSCLPYHIKDRIEYDNPKTMEEAMQKANFCFEQNKKKEGIANWKAKKNSNQPKFKKKEFVPQKNFRNNKNINHSNGNNFQGNINGAPNNSNNSNNFRERKLQTIMEILLRISNGRNLLSVGSVMAHTMLQFA